MGLIMSSLKFEIKGQMLAIYIFSRSLLEYLKQFSAGDSDAPHDIFTFGNFKADLNLFIDEENQKTKVEGYRTHINSEKKIEYKEYNEINCISPKFGLNIGDMMEMEDLKKLINPCFNYSSLYHWTGFGLYFFINNKDYTYFYAQESIRRNSSFRPWTPILILKSQFNQGMCLDLTRSIPIYFSILSKMIFSLDESIRNDGDSNLYKQSINNLIRKFKNKEIKEKYLIEKSNDKWDNFKKNMTYENFLECFHDLKILTEKGVFELINERAKIDAPNIALDSEKSHLLDCFIIRFIEYVYFEENVKDSKYIQTVKAAMHEPDFSKYWEDYLKKFENLGKTKMKKKLDSKISSFYGTKFHYIETKITPEVFQNENEIQNIFLKTWLIDKKEYNQAIGIDNLKFGAYKKNLIIDNCTFKDSLEIVERIIQQTLNERQILHFLSSKKKLLKHNRIILKKGKKPENRIKFTIYKGKSRKSIICTGTCNLERN